MAVVYTDITSASSFLTCGGTKSDELDGLAAYTNFICGRHKPQYCVPSIEKIIFNSPATIVFWSDGEKTVVKCFNEEFDPEKGLAMAISKRYLGFLGVNHHSFFAKTTSVPDIPNSDDRIKKLFDRNVKNTFEQMIIVNEIINEMDKDKGEHEEHPDK